MAAKMLSARATGDTDFVYYRYNPSMAAAIVFVALFACTAILHFYQIVRSKTRYFLVFAIGGVFEVISYGSRIYSITQKPHYDSGPYAVSNVFALIAPTLFAASIYMELGRIVDLVEGAKYLFVNRKVLTPIFVVGDVVSFFMQGAGAGLITSGKKKTADTGNTILVVGLFVQIVWFGIFVVCALAFQLRMRKGPSEKSTSTPWQKHMSALYIVSILIMIRSIFRAVEFIQGFDGYLISHEAYTYVFDATMMFFAMVVMNIIHPSEIQMLLHGGVAMTRGVRTVKHEV